jgi:UPF0755 protein
MQASRSWNRFVKRLALTLGLLIGLCALTCWYLWRDYHTPAAAEGPLTVVYFAPGTGAQQMAAQLHNAGLIRQRQMFLFYTMLRRVNARLQAGEYALRATMSPAQIIDTLSHGRVMHHALTIPEGAMLHDIARLTEAKGLGTQAEILTLARDASFIASLGLTVSSLEGYLFPETYHVPRGIKTPALLTMMVHTLRDNYTDEIAARGRQLSLTKHQVLTLASLIEKEAQVDVERPLISAVLQNRLRRSMHLQCDATVIYALGAAFDGNLRKTDMGYDSPYNTYRYAGLPPGPIANPGRRSIAAAVAPAAVHYLYYVATRQNGTHYFSTTLQEHNAAVQRYQRSR